jgi:hypothetical protein
MSFHKLPFHHRRHESYSERRRRDNRRYSQKRYER